MRFALLLGLLLAAPAHAALYKWFEFDGRVFYGHQPPPGVPVIPFRSDGLPTFDWEQEQFDKAWAAIKLRAEAGDVTAKRYVQTRTRVRQSLCELYTEFYRDAHGGLNRATARGPKIKYLYKSLQRYASQKQRYC